MKDRFNETYKRIINECNEKIVAEGWLGTAWNKIKQGAHKLNHFYNADSERDNATENDERFNTLFTGSGWEKVTDGKWKKQINGKTIKVKYDTGKKKIFIYVDGKFSGKLPLDPAADEDAIQKALNKMQKENDNIPILAGALKNKEQQDKDADAAAAQKKEDDENQDDPDDK